MYLNDISAAVCVVLMTTFSFISILVKMHTTRSPSASIQAGTVGDILDLSLTGSQLTMGRRPSSASPGKHFSRSISVSVASDGRGKRNTLVSMARRLCNFDKRMISHAVLYYHVLCNSNDFDAFYVRLHSYEQLGYYMLVHIKCVLSDLLSLWRQLC